MEGNNLEVKRMALFEEHGIIGKKAKQLISERKVVNSYYYKKDRSLKRWLMFIRNQYHYFGKYKRYFNNKGLHD